MTFKKRVITAIATGAVLVNAMAPLALADTNLTVSGNGALSNSAVNVTNASNTVVNQTNDANISNNIHSDASTGGNSSSFNTGGNTTVISGNATSNVTVNNAANLNQATVNCGCDTGSLSVNVTGNGAESSNGVNATNASSTFLNQNNDANFNNNISAYSSTGNNDASFNTGGNTTVISKNASTTVNVGNEANANFATIGGSNGGGSASVIVSGNGALSTNGVDLANVSAVVLNQNNDADITNHIHTNAKTGGNESQFNTGGDNGILSGNATDNVSVDNLANFNAADVNCDCTLSDLTAKVAGNGAESDNAINAANVSSLFPDQANDAALYNDIYGKAKTGENNLGFSTGTVYGDPVVISGDGTSTTDVNNAGNVNLLGNGTSVTLPGNWNVGVNFDLSGFLSFLQLV